MKAYQFSAAMTALAAMSIGPALAHTGHGPEPGFWSGMEHFLSSADHILALLAAGVVIGALARRWSVGGGLLIGFAAIFAIYHQTAFFSTSASYSFDAGFMLPAVGAMLGAFGLAKRLTREKHKSRSMS